MNILVRRSLGLACLIAFHAVSSVHAQPVPAAATAPEATSWAHKMFEKTSHDFGVIARGAKTTHQLRLTNIYRETVVIASVTPGCTCVSAKAAKTTLLSGEETFIEISMDTERFMRQRDTSVSVVFTQPKYQDVKIGVKGYIRTDVVITPGQANFGVVDVGAGSSQKLTIAFAGRADWRIDEVKCGNPNVLAKVVETQRNGGEIRYELAVTLAPETPVGPIRDQLMLLTNDLNSPQVPVEIQAQVEADVTVTPGTLVFDVGPNSDSVTKQLVIRGRKPIAIERIECERDHGAFLVKLPADAKAVHVLPMVFKAPKGMTESMDETFTVTITGRKEPIVFKARVNLPRTNTEAAAVSGR